jgi:hypothetical protein
MRDKGPPGDSRQDPANRPSHQAKKSDLRGSPPPRDFLRRAPKTRRHRGKEPSMDREAVQGEWKIGTIMEIPVR